MGLYLLQNHSMKQTEWSLSTFRLLRKFVEAKGLKTVGSILNFMPALNWIEELFFRVSEVFVFLLSNRRTRLQMEKIYKFSHIISKTKGKLGWERRTCELSSWILQRSKVCLFRDEVNQLYQIYLNLHFGSAQTISIHSFHQCCKLGMASITKCLVALHINHWYQCDLIKEKSKYLHTIFWTRSCLVIFVVFALDGFKFFQLAFLIIVCIYIQFSSMKPLGMMPLSLPNKACVLCLPFGT